jgi:DNA-directed RNA polymerase specialized sigma24 family protein
VETSCNDYRPHGGGRVRGESVFGSQDDEQNGLTRVLGREPTPELALEVAENYQQMLDQLQDETLRRVALWTLEGYSTEEVADKLGCVRRTVERKLERIREIWREADGPPVCPLQGNT